MAVLIMKANEYMTGKGAVDEAKAAKTNGIINGITEKTFEPQGIATRAQAAVVIIKLLEKKGEI